MAATGLPLETAVYFTFAIFRAAQNVYFLVGERQSKAPIVVNLGTQVWGFLVALSVALQVRLQAKNSMYLFNAQEPLFTFFLNKRLRPVEVLFLVLLLRLVLWAVVWFAHWLAFRGGLLGGRSVAPWVVLSV